MKEKEFKTGYDSEGTYLTRDEDGDCPYCKEAREQIKKLEEQRKNIKEQPFLD